MENQKRESRKSTKIQITVSNDVLANVNEYVEKNSKSRSEFINEALINYLQQKEMMAILRNVSDMCRAIANNPNADSETINKACNLMSMAQMVIGGNNA